MKLSIDFMTIESLMQASQEERINLIIKKMKDKKIIVFNGQFDPRDEAALIEGTMKHVNKQFPGIEICSLSYEELNPNMSWPLKLKHRLIKLLTGGRSGITVIGPAKIIKEIKREPDRISLLTK